MLERYATIFLDSFGGYGRYLLNEIIHPSWHSFFYGLLVVSVAVYGLELAFPWRKDQPRVRKDFWLDAFYMFFNFFLFSLIMDTTRPRTWWSTPSATLLSAVGVDKPGGDRDPRRWPWPGCSS